MAEDLFDALTRFHREVALPDMARIVDERIDPLRDLMLSSFDAVFKRLERLETEYQALTAGLRRIEERMSAVEQKIDRMALRSELTELRERVHTLEQRIAELEAQV